MTFINTVDGFAWLTLYLETIVSSLAWKPSTAATNIVLGVGSYTMQYNTRDTLGFAAKGAWFEIEKNILN